MAKQKRQGPTIDDMRKVFAQYQKLREEKTPRELVDLWAERVRKYYER